MAKKKSRDIPDNANSKATLEGLVSELGTISGALEKPGDHDWFKINLAEGTTYHFYLSFLDKDSTTSGNAVLQLWNAGDAVVLEGVDDDGGIDGNSILAFTPSNSGTFFIDVGAFGNDKAGTYGLFMISDAVSAMTDFLLPPNTDSNYTGVDDQRIVAGKGNDIINLGDASDALGEQGDDDISGSSSDNRISGGLGNDNLGGAAGNDIIFGDAGNDEIFGGSDTDTLFGGIGNDKIFGHAGTDALHGGAGKDWLTGDADQDVFVFGSVSISKTGTGRRDVIMDFTDEDIIAVSGIDAKRGGADNAFKFIGKQEFHEKKGELHYFKQGQNLIVEGDVNGDGKADFQIQVNGVGKLVASDFVL
jgi:Ca2+-binding RTX toxin-like protein